MAFYKGNTYTVYVEGIDANNNVIRKTGICAAENIGAATVTLDEVTSSTGFGGANFSPANPPFASQPELRVYGVVRRETAEDALIIQGTP